MARPVVFLELKSYNLEEAKIAVIKACVDKCNREGGKSQKEIATMLGVESGSTVSKYCIDYNIRWERPKTQVTQKQIDKAIAIVTALGYTPPPPPDSKTDES